MRLFCIVLTFLVSASFCGNAFAQNKGDNKRILNFKKRPLIRNTPGSARALSQANSGNTSIPYSYQPISVGTKDMAPNSTKDIDEATILEPSSGSNSDEIAINFESVDLMSLVRYISQETGRGFIINQALKGDVTIISPVTIGKEDAMAMLESILQVRGYTAVASGNLYKIVPLNEAKVAGTETRMSDELGMLKDDDTLITQIVPLQRTSVNEAQSILQTLLPRDSSMLLFPPSNTIVLTGRSVNIKRALEVLSELEKGLMKPGLDIVPLKFSAADDLKNQLEKIISSGGVERDEIRGGVNFISDKRSNSLLVLTSPSNFERIRMLIDRLDTATTDSRPELTKFYRLKYAQEGETVTQIETILGIGKPDKVYNATESFAIETTKLVPIKRTRSIMVTTRSEAMLTRIETLLKHLDSPPVQDASEVKVIRIENADSTQLAETLARLVQERNKSAQAKDGVLSFVSESHTNSIIMTGPPQMFSHYEAIIKGLDMMRHQILVEVLITEVSGNLTNSLGIEWNALNSTSNEWRAFGGTNYGLTGNPLTNSGFQLGLVKDALDMEKLAAGSLTELSKIKAMVKAYKNNSNFKILSAPQILTTDNEEAKISVGEVVALPQGFTQDRDTGRFDLTNFKYEDVGIVLNLTPRVNSKELVTLKLNQEIKKRQEENLYEFNVPVLTKRQMETTISVPNHRTVVIGGLMREDKTKVEERVPVLSNIPILGNVFKNRRNVVQKTNLLVFITPHILSTPEEVANFSSEMEKEGSYEKTVHEKNEKAVVELDKRMKNIREKARRAFERLKIKN